MTVFMELRSFIDSLKRRQIAITEVLERIANDPDIRGQTRDLLAEPHTFDGGIPVWLRNLMLEGGLTEDDIAHAESWPAAQKEAARVELLFAYDQNQPVHFAWDVHRGKRRFTRIRETDAGETEIVFSDPRQLLTVSADDSVQVEDTTAG
jgi:hypothetical protein